MVNIKTKEIKIPVVKDKKGLSKKVINIIRTTQRNNIELTSIADNKANVLLSLNAIVLAGLIPWVLSNMTLIIDSYLYIPLGILMVTCFSTIYQAAQILKPVDFDQKRDTTIPGINPSPFFFGNFYKMDASEYYDHLREGMSGENLVKAHLAQDLYYIGRRLGVKMSQTRRAFNIFILGIFLALLTTVLVVAVGQ